MTSDFFHTTVGVRQDCLLSLELFHIFFEQISCRKLSITTCQLYLLIAGIQVIIDLLTIYLITGRGSELQEQTYKYLGSTFKADGSLDDELRILLAASTSAMVKLGTMWQSKKLHSIYNTNSINHLISAILLYDL